MKRIIYAYLTQPLAFLGLVTCLCIAFLMVSGTVSYIYYQWHPVCVKELK